MNTEYQQRLETTKAQMTGEPDELEIWIAEAQNHTKTWTDEERALYTTKD